MCLRDGQCGSTAMQGPAQSHWGRAFKTTCSSRGGAQRQHWRRCLLRGCVAICSSGCRHVRFRLWRRTQLRDEKLVVRRNGGLGWWTSSAIYMYLLVTMTACQCIFMLCSPWVSLYVQWPLL